MARKRVLGDPPLREDSNSPSWHRWFSQLAENVFRVDKYTVTFNPASVAANTTVEQSMTVAGVGTDDLVIVQKPSVSAGLAINPVGRVSAVNTVQVTFINCTAGAIDAGSESYKVWVFKI